MSPRALRGAFAIVLVAALVVTPVQSGFATKPFDCAVFPLSGNWLADLAGLRMAVAYAVIAALAIFALPGRPLWMVVGIAMAVAIVVEVEQGLFIGGNCSASDLVPAFVATAFGAGLGILAKVFANRKRD